MSRAGKKEYSDHEKGAALAVVDFHAGNVRKAARLLGIPHTTLAEWVNGRHVTEVAQEVRTDKKIDLALRMDGILDRLARGLENEDKIAGARLNEVSTAFGTVFDKRQLMKGEPTSISESLTTEEKRAKVKAALRETGLLESHANN